MWQWKCFGHSCCWSTADLTTLDTPSLHVQISTTATSITSHCSRTTDKEMSASTTKMCVMLRNQISCTEGWTLHGREVQLYFLHKPGWADNTQVVLLWWGLFEIRHTVIQTNSRTDKVLFHNSLTKQLNKIYKFKIHLNFINNSSDTYNTGQIKIVHE